MFTLVIRSLPTATKKRPRFLVISLRNAWCIAGFIQATDKSSANCEMPWRSWRSMIPVLSSLPKRVRHLDSAFAAVSLACCTWKLSSSVWRMNVTSTLFKRSKRNLRDYHARRRASGDSQTTRRFLIAGTLRSLGNRSSELISFCLRNISVPA